MCSLSSKSWTLFYPVCRTRRRLFCIQSYGVPYRNIFQTDFTLFEEWKITLSGDFNCKLRGLCGLHTPFEEHGCRSALPRRSVFHAAMRTLETRGDPKLLFDAEIVSKLRAEK